MADKEIPEHLVKYTISNRSQVPEERAGRLETFQQDMAAFSRVTESSSRALDYFQTRIKRINSDIESRNFGLGVQEIVVSPSSAETVGKALAHRNEYLDISRDWSYNIDREEVPIVTGTKKIVGKEAFKIAQEAVTAQGGELWRDPTKKNPDRVRFYYPLEGADKMSDTEKKAYTSNLFKEASRESKQEEKDIKANEEAESYIAQEKSAEKKADEQTRIVGGVLGTITKILHDIYHVAQRILSSALRSTIQKEGNIPEDAVTGISELERRSSNIFEQAHGIQQGTFTRALQDIGTNFGDIRNLNNGAIITLAPVMGDKIGDLVHKGLGQSNPDQLMKLILDDYFAQWRKGKNSLDQQVGQEQALQELYQNLKNVSPAIADLFVRMATDAQSGFYGKITDFDTWRNTTQTNRTGVTQGDITYNQELGKVLNNILAAIKDVKDAFFVGVVNKLGDVFDWISNNRTGMSATENLATDDKNRELNRQTMQVITEEQEAYSATMKPYLEASVSDKYKKLATPENVIGALKNDINAAWLLENYRDSFSDNKGKAKKEAADALKELRQAGNRAFLNPEISDELSRYWAGLEQFEKLKKENAKAEDVGYLPFLAGEETAKAEAILKNRAVRAAYNEDVRETPEYQGNVNEATKEYLYNRLSAPETAFDAYAVKSVLTGENIALPKLIGEYRNANLLLNTMNLGGISDKDVLASSGISNQEYQDAVAKYKDIHKMSKTKALTNTQSVQLINSLMLEKAREAKEKELQRKLTPEEENALWIETLIRPLESNVIDAYSKLYTEKSSEDPLLQKFYEKTVIDKQIENLNKGDAAVMADTVRTLQLNNVPEGAYDITGSKAKTGVFTIEVRDSRTKETKYFELGEKDYNEASMQLILGDDKIKYQEMKGGK